MLAYEKYFEEASAFYNVPVAALKAVAWIESRGVPDVTPRWEAHLNEHSYGIGQFLPSTALWILRTPARFPLVPEVRTQLLEGRRGQVKRGERALNVVLQDPEVGIHLIAAYLRYQLDRYEGNLTDAVAAYNAGSVRRTPQDTYVNQWHVDKFEDALDKFTTRIA